MRDTRGPYHRLTVNLSEKADAALDKSAERQEETRTDVVNRALLLYDYLTGVQARGGSIMVEHNGVTDRVMVL